MTSTDELRALLERVEAAPGPDREIDRDLYIAFNPDTHETKLLTGFFTDVSGLTLSASGFHYRTPNGSGSSILPSYTASIDAALALVERVLPGWDTEIGIQAGFTWVQLDDPTAMSSPRFALGEGKTPPLAILAALLHTLISQTGDDRHAE